MKVFRYCLFCLLLIIHCTQTSSYEPYTVSKFLMDTYVRISVYDRHKPTSKLENLIDSTFSTMQRLEGKLSAHHKGGEIYTINRLAHMKWVEVSEPVWDCLNKCLQVGQLSSGKFDISIGAIKQYWCFLPDSAVIPDRKLIEQMLPKVDFRKIYLQNGKIRFKEKGMKIDLGGAAKGYIIDKAMDILKNAGIDSVIMEAGGDFLISGNHPEREKWRIGVRHPRKKGMKIAAVIETKATGFATSGDYERYFYKNGIRYHHLLDPETGYPANKCISVTITAETAFMADALATAVFIMGPDTGIQLIEELQPIEGLINFMNNENELSYTMSKGFTGEINL